MLLFQRRQWRIPQQQQPRRALRQRAPALQAPRAALRLEPLQAQGLKLCRARKRLRQGQPKGARHSRGGRASRTHLPSWQQTAHAQSEGGIWRAP